MNTKPMATPNNRRLTKPCRYVEGVINSLAAVTIVFLCVLGMGQAIDLLMGVLR